MGRIATTQTDDLGVVTMTAGATIAAGDLVINTDGGRAVKATSDLAFSTNNSTTAGATTISTSVNFESSGTYGPTVDYRYRSSCEISDGNIVHTYAGDGTTASSRVNFLIRNISNGTVVNRVLVSTNTSISCIRVSSLPTQNKFVVAWATSTTVSARIYNNDGTAVAAAFTVFTDAQSATPEYWTLSHLSNGEFVILRNGSTSPYPLSFRRYNSSGTLQGSQTDVEANSNAFYFSVCPVAAGGFVVGWYSAQNSRHSMSKYDSSGVIVGSQVNISNSSTNLTKGNFDDNQIIELSDGKIVKIYPNTSITYLHAYLCNADLSLISNINLTSGAPNSTTTWPGLCRFGSGFATVISASNNLRLLTFTNSGGNTSNNTASGANSAGGSVVSACGPDATHFGGGFFGIFNVGNNDGSQSYDQKYAVVDMTGTTSGSAITVQTSNTQYDIYSFWTSGNINVSRKNISSQNSSYTINNLRKSVLGVALNSVSVDQSVRLATKGNYQLTSDYASGGNFDNLATTVPGTKGNVVGTTANLFGMT